MPRQILDSPLARFKTLILRLRAPAELNEHPLTQPAFLVELTRGLDPSRISEDPEGAGWQLVGALCIVVKQLLKQALKLDAQVGCLLVWIYDLRPIVSGTDPVSIPETIQAYLAKREHLVQVLYDTGLVTNPNKLSPDEEKLFHTLRAELSGLSERNAAKRREKALTLILKRLERAAHTLQLNLFECLVPDAKVAAQQRTLPFAAKPLSEPSESVLETVVLDSKDSQHSTNAVVIVEPQCAAPDPFDGRQAYFRYLEKKPLIQAGTQDSLPDNLFIARRVLRLRGSEPQALTRVFDEAAKWIVLSGERGSGRTTALDWLARRSPDRPAIVLDAKAYAELVPHVSPFEWIAVQVYPDEQDEERRLFEIWLAEQDKAQRVVWLVDDLFVIPSDERKWVVRGLQRVKGNIVITAPTNLAVDMIREITKGDDSAFELVPLDEQDVEAYIERYHEFYGAVLDDLLCRRVCREVPDLATSPLGLALVCAQVCLQESDCATVIARFINELYLRSGLQPPPWRLWVQTPSPEALALWYGALDVAGSLRSRHSDLPPLAFIRSNASDEETCFYDESPLLTRLGPRKVWQFINGSVVAFLCAHHNLREGIYRFLTQNSPQPTDLLMCRCEEAMLQRGWRAHTLWWLEPVPVLSSDSITPEGQPAA